MLYGTCWPNGVGGAGCASQSETLSFLWITSLLSYRKRWGEEYCVGAYGVGKFEVGRAEGECGWRGKTVAATQPTPSYPSPTAPSLPTAPPLLPTPPLTPPTSPPPTVSHRATPEP